MKILKYFFYSLLILFLLFVANGLLNSEIEYSAEIMINQTPEKCWEVITDPGKKVEWVSNFQSIETAVETADMVGSKYLITVIDAGQEYELTETVTNYDPPIYYAFERENDLLVNNIEFTIEATGISATRIITTHTLEGKDVLMKSIFPFMKGLFTSQAESEIAKLKTVIEKKD